MAVASWLKGSILKYVYHSSCLCNKNPGQPFFFRGFASTLFVKAKVVRDKVRNRSKGYGFVTFAEEDDARKALIAMNGQLLDGRVIFVDKETSSSAPRTTNRVADE